LARVLTLDGWSRTQNNNNMNTAKKTSLSLLTGLLVLIATLATPISNASASDSTGNSMLPYIITEQEINELLSFASIDNEVKIENVKIKIFGSNDDLVYSSKVCHSTFNCDERLNQLINQSDFITEVDNTRIYILNQ
jgi:hypothetical protein